MNNPPPIATVNATKAWILNFVIQLNLCPFAKVPFEKDRIRYIVFEGSSLEKLLELLIEESNQLLQSDPALTETTIIIIKDFLKDFRAYLDVVGLSEDLLTSTGMDYDIQIASFHPDYQFAGTEKDTLSNFTNRSPFPLLHLLRADRLEKAIEAYGDTSKIPENNISTLEKMGFEALQNILK